MKLYSKISIIVFKKNKGSIKKYFQMKFLEGFLKFFKQIIIFLAQHGPTCSPLFAYKQVTCLNT